MFTVQSVPRNKNARRQMAIGIALVGQEDDDGQKQW